MRGPRGGSGNGNLIHAMVGTVCVGMCGGGHLSILGPIGSSDLRKPMKREGGGAGHRWESTGLSQEGIASAQIHMCPVYPPPPLDSIICPTQLLEDFVSGPSTPMDPGVGRFEKYKIRWPLMALEGRSTATLPSQCSGLQSTSTTSRPYRS